MALSPASFIAVPDEEEHAFGASGAPRSPSDSARGRSALRVASVLGVAATVGAVVWLGRQASAGSSLQLRPPGSSGAEAESMAAFAETPQKTKSAFKKGKVSSNRSGSFLVIGDWGFDEKHHGNVSGTGCQKAIAQKMLRTMEELGDVKFIINVGDSFYPAGLSGRDDPQWDTKWRNVYDPALRSVPWYSVYGNHDYHQDPCSCSGDPNDCAQVNYDPDDLDRFYMPGHSWYKEHPELGVEVIAMDLNKFQGGWNHSATAKELKFHDCKWAKCEADCFGNADVRAEQAFSMFSERFQRTTAKHLLVFSHYPTDYLLAMPDFLRNLSTADNFGITYFAGHRHNVDSSSTWQTSPNKNWVVGGGGGWSCEGKEEGFVVGTIGLDNSVHTRASLVDVDMCCPPPPPQPTKT